MELITNIIVGYLKHNKRIVVPQLGMFIVKPGGEIIFSELMRGDDGVLRQLLVAYGVNELAANGMIDRFRFEIKHSISSGQSHIIDNFGEFTAGDNGTIRFSQKREPQVFGGKIKPPIERFEEERLKLQRIQRIRQQQSENITGHTTHRKLRTSQAISSQPTSRDSDIDDMSLGKPDKYLRGLKYDNKKSRNQDDEGFSNSRKSQNRGGRIVLFLLIFAAIGVGIWFTWQWIQQNGNITSVTPTEDNVTVEPTDSLATPAVDIPDTDATAPAATEPASQSTTTAATTASSTSAVAPMATLLNVTTPTMQQTGVSQHK